MVSSWRKSKKEEKKSLLSGRHQGSSYKPPPKKKNSSFFAKHERTPPVTPSDDDEFRYDVAIVASEYDPSQSFGMSGPKPIARYPSTPMRKVEFKPDKAPPVFTPPPPLTEESVMASMQHVTWTAQGKEKSPPPPQPGNSLYSQTMKFIDDICQIPTPQDKGAVNGTPEWGTAPSGDDSTYGPSYQTSTTPGESEGFTQYSRSYLASQGSHGNRFTELPAPKEEFIEHENYEVVLDMANLAASPQSTPNRKGHSSIKADSKRSMVRRLFSGRKKEDFKDDSNDASVEKETHKVPIYDEPEIQDDAAVMDYPELREEGPADPPANHAREIAVTRVPPTRERSLISPVEEVLNSIGNLFSFYTEEEKKEEPEVLVTPMETPKRSFDDYAEEVGPEDEIEENLTPNTSFAETDERSVLASIGAPLVDQPKMEKKDKAKRALNLGVFAKRISKKKKTKKEKPLWLPAVDRKTGRTYWYNRITRESTYHPPTLASEPETEEGAPKPEPKEQLTPISEVVANEYKDAPTYGVSARGKPLNANQNKAIATSPKKAKLENPQTRAVGTMDITPKKKNSKNEKPLWLAAVDRKTGRTYWYNRITRESTFNPPPGALDSEMEVVAHKPEVALDVAVAQPKAYARDSQPKVDALKMEPKAEPGPVMKESMAEVKEAPSDLPKTKPIWKTAVDPKSGRTYWYNRVTRESTYNPPPEAFVQETEMESPALPVKSKSDLAIVEVREEPKPESQEETKPEAEEELLSESKEELPSESKEEPKPESKEELNETHKKKKPLWKTAVDAKSGRTYWYNRVTRVSTYNPPPEAFVQETEVESPALPPKAQSNPADVEASEEAKSDSQEEPNLESKETLNETPKKKKPLWKTAVDHKSGRTYWYNRVTRESTYNPPADALVQETEVDATTPQKETKSETEVNKTVTEVNKEVTETQTTAAVVSPESDAMSPQKKSKKPTWRAVVDDKTGRPYYYHRKTGETTWKMPEELKALKEAELSTASKTEVASPGSAHRDAEEETPPLVVSAEVSEESMVRIKKGEQGLLDNSYEREDDEVEEQDAFELASTDENPFDEPIVNVGDIPMPRASSASRSGTFMSRTSATTKSSVKTDKTERIRNTGPVNNTSKAIETISETTSNATSISSHHDESRLNTPERPSSLVRPRELKVEELTGSRVAAETYDRVGRVMCGKSEDIEEGSYYGDNEYGDDSVSALSETEADFSQRKENFEQARRRALDDAIEREDWDLAAALSEGMRATTTTGDYTKSHQSWKQSELDKFIAVNDWDAVKSYIARMREAKKSVREELPPVISKTFSTASDPTVRVATSSRNIVSPPTITESSSIPYEKRIGSRSQVQHERIQQAESEESDSSSSDDSTELSRSLDEETNYSEYS